MSTPLQNGPAEQAVPKPSQLMRSWHPDLFPDTEVVRPATLPKDFLEYHLETLTARKQEQMFEEFCRRLLEREVCPNLKPQTGPTGGGDSKMDASTYPVAPALAGRYYWGSPSPPTTELWAFAFSCKKKWKEKVKEDAKKLAALTPKPKVAYFVTNQFVRDKERAGLEGSLSKQHGFEAHILDRTWIVKCVLERGHERVAIASLNIDYAAPAEERAGPRDARRRQELEAIEARCRDLETYHGNDYALAQDYLEAARLARGLGRPRREVDGFFERSRRLARQTGVPGLIVRTAYHQAWTAFWWYDDMDTLAAIYGEVEQQLPQMTDADDCELFLNLWTLLFSMVRQGARTAEAVRLEERREALARELEKQAAEQHRPVNALEARTELLMLRVFGAEGDAGEVGSILDGLGDCLDRSRSVGAYPALQVINRLKVFEQHLGEHPRFGPLFEKMRAVVRERGGEASEGSLLCRRGGQLLAASKFTEALAHLGQARSRLFKDETMRGAVLASIGCSHAYFSMGHLWAARMEAMIAAHVALRQDEGELFCPREGFWAVMTLARIDLCLGRVTAFLGWFETALFLRRYQATRNRGVKRIERQLATLEVLLTVRFLAADPSSLVAFEPVLGTLSRMPLDMARWALLHRLGRTAEAFAEFPKDQADTPEKMAAYFDSMVQMSDCQGLLPLADPGTPFVQMSARLLGVDYRIRARNEYGILLMAENLLAVLEAALASARWENLAFIHDRFDLTLDVEEGASNPPEIRFERPHGRDGYRLTFGPGVLDWMNRGPRSEVSDFFGHFLFAVLLTTTIDPYDDLQAEFTCWHGEEVFSRALSLSPLSIMTDSLIGRKGYDLDHWREAADAPAV